MQGRLIIFPTRSFDLLVVNSNEKITKNWPKYHRNDIINTIFIW